MTPLLALKATFVAAIVLTALFAVLDSHKRASWRMVASSAAAIATLAAIWLTTVGKTAAPNAFTAIFPAALFIASNAWICSIADKNDLRSPVWTSATTLVAVGVFLGACDAEGYIGAHMDLSNVIGGGCLALAITTAGLALLSKEQLRTFLHKHRSDIGIALIILAAVMLLAGLTTTALDKKPSITPLTLPELFGEHSSASLLITVLACSGTALCTVDRSARWLVPAVLAPSLLCACGMPIGYSIAAALASTCIVVMSDKTSSKGKAGLSAVCIIGMLLVAALSPAATLDAPLVFSASTSGAAEALGPSLAVFSDASPLGWNPAGLAHADNATNAHFPVTLSVFTLGAIGVAAILVLVLATPWRPEASNATTHKACPASLPLAVVLGILALCNAGSNLGLFPDAIGNMPLLSTGLWSTLASLAAIAAMVCTRLPEGTHTADESCANNDAASAQPSDVAPAETVQAESLQDGAPSKPSTCGMSRRGLALGIGTFAGLCVLSLALVAGAGAWASSETKRIDEGAMLFYVSTMESHDDLAECRLSEYATGKFDRNFSLADAVDGSRTGGVLLRVEDTYGQVVAERIWRIAPGRIHAHQLYRATVKLEDASVFPGPESAIPLLVDDSEFDKDLNDELSKLAQSGYDEIKFNSSDEKICDKMLAVLKAGSVGKVGVTALPQGKPAVAQDLRSSPYPTPPPACRQARGWRRWRPLLCVFPLV